VVDLGENGVKCGGIGWNWVEVCGIGEIGGGCVYKRDRGWSRKRRMPEKDRTRRLTHCGNPFCGLEITESEKEHGNFWHFDENRLEHSAEECAGMEPDWQIVHNTCPRQPGSGCKRCGQDSFECTCGVS
jgi:hypothetical protein